MGTVLDFQLSVPDTADKDVVTAVRSAVHLMQHLFERSTSEEILVAGRILNRVGESPPDLEPEKQELVRDLTRGRFISVAERFALEASALERSFEMRRSLLQDAMSATDVARILGISRQSVHERAKKGALLAVLDRGSLRFPPWQFDPQGSGGAIEGLPEVLQCLDTSPLGKVSWLTKSNPYFEGRTLLDLLKYGERKQVLEAARAVGVL